MNNTEIVAAIDTEVARLTKVRSILAEAVKMGSTERLGGAVKVDAPRRGRPKGSRNKASGTAVASAKPVVATAKKSVLSLEARARIAAAQRARWAQQSAAVAAKSAATKAAPGKAGKGAGSKAAAKKAVAKKSAAPVAKKASVAAKKSPATKAVAKKTSGKSAPFKAPAKKVAAKKRASAKNAAVKVASTVVPSASDTAVVATA